MAKKLYTDLGFTSREQYFKYIVESIENGQRDQATDLIKALSKQDKKMAFKWMGWPFKEGHKGEAQRMVFESI